MSQSGPDTVIVTWPLAKPEREREEPVEGQEKVRDWPGTRVLSVVVTWGEVVRVEATVMECDVAVVT